MTILFLFSRREIKKTSSKSTSFLHKNFFGASGSELHLNDGDNRDNNFTVDNKILSLRADLWSWRYQSRKEIFLFFPDTKLSRYDKKSFVILSVVIFVIVLSFRFVYLMICILRYLWKNHWIPNMLDWYHLIRKILVLSKTYIQYQSYEALSLREMWIFLLLVLTIIMVFFFWHFRSNSLTP